MKTESLKAILGAVLLAGTLVPITAIAQTDPPAARAVASATDRDANGLDDGLETALDQAAPADRFDVIVTFGGPADEVGARRAVGPFSTYARFSIISGFAANMTAAQIQGLARTPGIFRIQPDSLVTVTNESANADFGTAAARTDYAVDGTGVGICIVDTGVDPAHEQLDNGKVVDSIDLVNGLAVAYDDHGHGTHVAATAAGDGSGPSADAAAFAGVAPGASIFAAKVLDSAGGGAESNVVLGIEWCAAQSDVDIVSLSLGTAEGSDGADAMAQAVNNAVTISGKAVTAAAGNSGDGTNTVISPGSAQHAITVGAVAEYSAPLGTDRHSNGIHLAGFSSRGPTAAGLIKPDIVAPGVSITSAQANAPSGYTTFSGTSMATPFVAGTLALALQANPGLTPAQLKTMVTETAQDRGAAGPDINWGAGLLDALAVVSTASGGPTATTDFPRNETGAGSVTPGAEFTHDFTLTAADLNTPIGITLLIDGAPECVFIFGICFGIEWAPDLDAELWDPTGVVIASSICPGDPSGHCGTPGVTMGQQETLATMPTTAGTYQLRVNAVSEGGAFIFDISAGAPGPVVPPNTAPIADAGVNRTVTDADNNGTETVTLDGSASDDPDGTIVSWQWSDSGGAVILDGETTAASLGIGVHTITLTVTDNQGATDTDTVTVTVQVGPGGNTPPTANAGPDQTVTDTDGNGVETVNLTGRASSDPDGRIVSHAWVDSLGASIPARPNPKNVSLAVGVHTITLTVTDNQGATGTDTVVVTVNPPAANTAPTANAGPDQVVTDTDNSGSEVVTLDGSGSNDPDGTIASSVWRDSTGSVVGNGATPQVDLAVGVVHTLTLTVTDNQAATATDTVDILVNPPLPILGTSHVHDLEGTTSPVGKNQWQATVSIYVVGTELEESLGIALGLDPSVVVFSLSTGGTLTCTTQAAPDLSTDGRCQVTTSALKKGVKSVTLAVQSITLDGIAYVPAGNHDVDLDTNGTSITLTQP